MTKAQRRGSESERACVVVHGGGEAACSAKHPLVQLADTDFGFKNIYSLQLLLHKKALSSEIDDKLLEIYGKLPCQRR